MSTCSRSMMSCETTGLFLVFRKLQQDVVGFRQFLKNQRPDSDQQQKKLAAELMGRWQNGTPLVVSPDTPLELNDDNDPRPQRLSLRPGRSAGPKVPPRLPRPTVESA